jgi:hypothetical protein
MDEMEQRRAVLPPDEVKRICEALQQRHRAHLRPGDRFECEGWMTHGEARAQLKLRDPSEEEVLILQARVDLVEQDIQDPNDGKALALDVLDLAVQEYFAQERIWSPSLDWGEEPHQEKTVWLRGRRRNLKLDRIAAELLGEELEPDFDAP